MNVNSIARQISRASAIIVKAQSALEALAGEKPVAARGPKVKATKAAPAARGPKAKGAKAAPAARGPKAKPAKAEVAKRGPKGKAAPAKVAKAKKVVADDDFPDA